METQTQYREAVETAVGNVFQRTSLPEQAIFRKEGEYWAIGRGGNAFRLKDTKGLGYLAHLLRHPAAEIHVLDLAGGIAGQRDHNETRQFARGLPRAEEDLEKAGIHIGSLGDAGEMLDEQAKAAYKRRLSELREDLAEAKEVGNIERAGQAEREISALTRELSRAVGLGGRSRRAASASERARQSITKTIKSVVERIGQSDARLGDVFSRCIKTGNFCSYRPDPDFQIAWEFAAPAIEPSERLTSSGEPAPAHAGRPQASAVMLDASPFPLGERAAFVGCESEVSAIRAAIDRALSGHGSIAMLGGGPGVGKTRLAMAQPFKDTRARDIRPVTTRMGDEQEVTVWALLLVAGSVDFDGWLHLVDKDLRFRVQNEPDSGARRGDFPYGGSGRNRTAHGTRSPLQRKSRFSGEINQFHRFSGG